MSDGWYDTAQVCMNGHVATIALESSPERARKFCEECGEKTVSEAPSATMRFRDTTTHPACLQHMNTSLRNTAAGAAARTRGLRGCYRNW